MLNSAEREGMEGTHSNYQNVRGKKKREKSKVLEHYGGLSARRSPEGQRDCREGYQKKSVGTKRREEMGLRKK